ncbi:MAG TPA: SDR family oxidoreductase, partial [Dyadobacter sp.]|nr:SDR family oxidoreductase [Dyadobacter sp.]
MNLNLTGKTALVCGSTQGIGKATALELAQLGANVTLIARNETALRETVELLDTTSGQLHRYIVADFSDNENVKEALANYLRLCPDVQILINNTGGPAGGQAIDAESEKFVKAFQMHLVNYQNITQAVVPSMKQAGFGRIVNIISTSVKQPIAGLGVSNTIRAAVASWSKTLSAELGPFGITSNNVLPGYTKTARLDAVLQMRSEASGKSLEEVTQTLQNAIPIKRFSEAAEVAAAVAFLCSPAAGSINGINLPV